MIAPFETSSPSPTDQKSNWVNPPGKSRNLIDRRVKLMTPVFVERALSTPLVKNE